MPQRSKSPISGTADGGDGSIDVKREVKHGSEAYATVKNVREGSSYRKNGGPLVCVVSKVRAVEICEKETAIGMM